MEKSFLAIFTSLSYTRTSCLTFKINPVILQRITYHCWIRSRDLWIQILMPNHLSYQILLDKYGQN